MTQNEKDLLLKDLCARLPYGVWNEHKLKQCKFGAKGMLHAHDIDSIERGQYDFYKPYLFPLSSMTDEQKEFIKNKFCYDWDIDDHPYSLWAHCIDIGDIDELIDWFHKNHIDYRGLIPMGIAIDATGLKIY